MKHIKPPLPQYRRNGIHFFFDMDDGLDLTIGLEKYDNLLTFKNVIGKHWYYFKYWWYKIRVKYYG